MVEQTLAGRVAIVTGSGRRIGREVALALAGEGAAVIINGRTAANDVDAVVETIRGAGGRAAPCLADVSKPPDAAALIQAAIDAFGRLDILINNAAVRRRVPLAEMTFEEWRHITGIILDGAFLCARQAAPHLAKSGHGRIINLGGAGAFQGSTEHAHVNAAKLGLVGLTRALAHELGPRGVTVNMLSPGLIETPDDDPVRAAERRANFRVDAIPLGRTGTPPDIARAAVALAGDAFGYMTGQVIHVNGGLFMG
jgi:3-oxoacyl-[acyl-carrier protein] reductase